MAKVILSKEHTAIRAVIFDLDGTLIDTERFYAEVWPRTIAELGFVMTREQYLSLRSLGRPFAPNQFREWYGQDFDYDGARAIRKVYFDELVAKYGVPRKKGAVELLTYLREHGVVTAIATATDLDRATEYLKKAGLDGYFDRVISARMVAEGKPSPDVYLYACEQLGFLPEECMAVEDAPNGILSAYRAGLRVVMVPDQTGPDAESASRLYACVESLDRIMDLFEPDDRE